MFFRRDCWRIANLYFDVLRLQKTRATLGLHCRQIISSIWIYKIFMLFSRQMYSQKKRKKKIRARSPKVKRNPIVQPTCAVTLSVSVTWKNWKDLTFVTSISWKTKPVLLSRVTLWRNQTQGDVQTLRQSYQTEERGKSAKREQIISPSGSFSASQ